MCKEIMDKKAFDKLIISPPPCTTSSTLQSTGSATGNPRNKCALKPGHSLMDWIRLGNSGTDLSGTRGHLISVSNEELAKHNTPNDAWMAIQGVVYNVTQYMEFHPGGTSELMRGVGSDATKLFNDTHAWVNYAQLLNKCRIGPLTNTSIFDANIKQSQYLRINNTFRKPLTSMQQTDILPRLDWIQKPDNITLYFYTTQFCNPGLLLQNLVHEDRRIEIWILIDLFVHKFDFELQGRIKWPPKGVQISTESGKIEIELNKHDEHINIWSDLGKYQSSKVVATDLEVEKRFAFKMLYKSKINNDSYVMLLKNHNAIYSFPVGYHLTIESFLNGKKIQKCYTPVPKNYVSKYINSERDVDYCIHFLVKHYSTPNSFSQYLCNLEENSRIEVSLPMGKLKLLPLATHRKFCFIAAGSGLTPFLGLIDHLLRRNTNRIEVLKLFYFNKTINDIWCNEILTNISANDGRFEFVNILSNADDSWSGLKGRVSSELLFPIGNKSMENFSYIVTCGPSNFIACVEKILKDFNFPSQNLFIF